MSIARAAGWLDLGSQGPEDKVPCWRQLLCLYNPVLWSFLSLFSPVSWWTSHCFQSTFGLLGKHSEISLGLKLLQPLQCWDLGAGEGLFIHHSPPPPSLMWSWRSAELCLCSCFLYCLVQLMKTLLFVGNLGSQAARTLALQGFTILKCYLCGSGLQRWLSSQGHLLPFQCTWAPFPEPTLCGFQTTYNCSSRPSVTPFWHLFASAHTCTHTRV